MGLRKSQAKVGMASMQPNSKLHNTVTETTPLLNTRYRFVIRNKMKQFCFYSL